MNIDKTKRTRLKIAWSVNVFLAIITVLAVFKGMETLATSAIAGILTITTMYIGGDSYRSSKK